MSGEGIFVPVVGPSGSGKDSLISYARKRLADRPSIHFARRTITRRADPETEDHDTLDKAGFLAAEAAGAFAISWRSHGLCYGIARDVEQHLSAGGIVVANLSRGSVREACARFARVIPVLVTVSPAVLAARLAARGRETSTEIADRLARNAAYKAFDIACHEIDNSGPLEQAGEALLALLEGARTRKPALHDQAGW